MSNSEEQIKREIFAYMSKYGGPASAWYAGISKDPRNRLFSDHSVAENGDAWIYDWASSASAARRIEAHFINQVGTDGGTGGGDEEATGVYAYKKNWHTQP